MLDSPCVSHSLVALLSTLIMNPDAPLTSLCDMGGKRSQLEVPLDDFARVISMAMDDIGCAADSVFAF